MSEKTYLLVILSLKVNYFSYIIQTKRVSSQGQKLPLVCLKLNSLAKIHVIVSTNYISPILILFSTIFCCCRSLNFRGLRQALFAERFLSQSSAWESEMFTFAKLVNTYVNNKTCFVIYVIDNNYIYIYIYILLELRSNQLFGNKISG